MRTVLVPSILALALTGCGAPMDSLEEDTQALTQLPVPNSMGLQASGPAAPGRPYAFLISNAPPNRTVYIVASPRPPAAGPTGFCPPFLRGSCLDLVSPVTVLGQTTSDANGDAVFSSTVPNVPIGYTIHAQAVVLDPAGAETSNPLQVVATDDGDGDGYCAGSAPCLDPAALPGDCDDLNASAFPGALEVCDSVDNDCDAVIDEPDAWWNPAWPYRVQVEVAGSPDWNTQGLPVSIDVDFRALLDALGDTSSFEPGSVRVVYQDCDAGIPELPAEFIDEVSGLFDKVAVDDPAGDEFGAVTFLYDTDGDYASLEQLLAGATGTFAIYFGSAGTTPGVAAPAYGTSLVATSDGVTAELSNARSEALFAAGQGGITTRVATVGRNTTGAQTSSLLGNGIYLGNPAGGAGDWVSARLDTAATLELLHAGPVAGVVRASGAVGNAFGGFDYAYTYVLFEGRPELYTKAYFELNQPSNVGPQATFFGAAVRPYMINNNALSSGAASDGGADIPAYEWVRGGYATGSASPYGIALGYRNSVALRSRPIFDAGGTANAGRFVGLAGQDVTATFVNGQTSYAGNAGDVIVDHSIVAVYPFPGLFNSVSVDFFGTLDGASATLSSPEAQ